MKFTNNITALILSVLLVAALFASCMPAKDEESQGESSLPEVSESTPESSSASEEPEEQPEPKEYYAKDYEFEIPDFPDAETERLALIEFLYIVNSVDGLGIERITSHAIKCVGRIDNYAAGAKPLSRLFNNSLGVLLVLYNDHCRNLLMCEFNHFPYLKART